MKQRKDFLCGKIPMGVVSLLLCLVIVFGQLPLTAIGHNAEEQHNEIYVEEQAIAQEEQEEKQEEEAGRFQEGIINSIITGKMSLAANTGSQGGSNRANPLEDEQLDDARVLELVENNRGELISSHRLGTIDLDAVGSTPRALQFDGEVTNLRRDMTGVIEQRMENTVRDFRVTDFTQTLTTERAQELSEAGMAEIVVFVPMDVWRDGSGYQMWLSRGTEMFADFMPSPDNQSAFWAWMRETNAQNAWDYTIPHNAGVEHNSPAVRPGTFEVLEVDAGIFQFIFANPSDDPEFAGFYLPQYGVNRDTMIFEAGKRYVFTPIQVPVILVFPTHYERGFGDFIDFGVAQAGQNAVITRVFPDFCEPRISRVQQTHLFWSEYEGEIEWANDLGTPDPTYWLWDGWFHTYADVGLFDYGKVYTAHVELVAREFFEFSRDLTATDIFYFPHGHFHRDRIDVDNVSVSPDGSILTFTVTFDRTAPVPDGVFTALAIDRGSAMLGSWFTHLLMFDPTQTVYERVQQNPDYMIDMELDFDYFVPSIKPIERGIRTAAGGAMLFRARDFNSRIPAGGHDWFMFSFNLFAFIGIADGGSQNFEAGEVYAFIFDIEVEGGVGYIVVNVYKMEQTVERAFARPAALGSTGGRARIGFEGVLAEGIPIRVYENGELVTAEWATGHTTVGDPNLQLLSIEFPPNAGAMTTYTIRVEGHNVGATVTTGETGHGYAIVRLQEYNNRPGGGATLISPHERFQQGHQLLLDSTATADGSINHRDYDLMIPFDADRGWQHNINMSTDYGFGYGISAPMLVPAGTYDAFVGALRHDGTFTPAQSAAFRGLYLADGVEYTFVAAADVRFAPGGMEIVYNIRKILLIDGRDYSGEIADIAITPPAALETPQLTIAADESEDRLYGGGSIVWTTTNNESGLERFRFKREYTATVTLYAHPENPGALAMLAGYRVNGQVPSNVQRLGNRVIFEFTFTSTDGVFGRTGTDPLATIVFENNAPQFANHLVQMLLDPSGTAIFNHPTSHQGREAYALSMPSDAARGGTLEPFTSYTLRVTPGVYSYVAVSMFPSQIDSPQGGIGNWNLLAPFTTVIQDGVLRQIGVANGENFEFEAGMIYTFRRTQGTDAGEAAVGFLSRTVTDAPTFPEMNVWAENIIDAENGGFTAILNEAPNEDAPYGIGLHFRINRGVWMPLPITDYQWNPFGVAGSADAANIVSLSFEPFGQTEEPQEIEVRMTISGNQVSYLFFVEGTGQNWTQVTPAPINVTAPIAGELADTAITSTGNFTGYVVWSPAPINGRFDYFTEYTATVTLVADSGYSFESFDATNVEGFTINGLTPSFAGRTVVSMFLEVTFPASGLRPLTANTLNFAPTWPTFGNIPNMTLLSGQFNSNVLNEQFTWAPVVIDSYPEQLATQAGWYMRLPGATDYAPIAGPTTTLQGSITAATAAAGRSYIAYIQITPREGWTIEGLPSDFFSIPMFQSVEFDSTTGIITARVTAARLPVGLTDVGPPTGQAVSSPEHPHIRTWNGAPFDLHTFDNGRSAWFFQGDLPGLYNTVAVGGVLIPPNTVVGDPEWLLREGISWVFTILPEYTTGVGRFDDNLLYVYEPGLFHLGIEVVVEPDHPSHFNGPNNFVTAFLRVDRGGASVAPTPQSTPAHVGLADGRITNLIPFVQYDVRFAGESGFFTRFANADGQITGLVAGVREVRVADSSVMGASPWVAVSIGTQPLPTTSAEIAASDEYRIAWEIIRGNNIFENNVTNSLNLPTSGHFGSVIRWTSNNPEILSNAGVVTRPTFTEGNADVILTADVENDGETRRVTFVLRVIAHAATDRESLDADLFALTWYLIRQQNEGQNQVRTDLNLVTVGASGSTITWASSDPNTVSPDGVVTRPPFGQPNANVTLTATLRLGALTETAVFEVVVLMSDTADELVDAALAQVTWELIRLENAEESAVVGNLNLVTQIEIDGVNVEISWHSTNANVIAANGQVQRPPHLAMNARVILTATARFGEASGTTTFTLVVLRDELTGNARLLADAALMTWNLIRGRNTSPNAVASNLMLPTRGLGGSSIVWSSSDINVINANGIVTRPTGGNTQVTMTATLSLEGETQVVEIVLNVIGR